MARKFIGQPDTVAIGGMVSFAVVHAIEQYCARNGCSKSDVIRLALSAWAGRRGLIAAPPPSLPWVLSDIEKRRQYRAEIGDGRVVLVRQSDRSGVWTDIRLEDPGMEEEVAWQVNYHMWQAAYIAGIIAADRWPDLRTLFPPWQDPRRKLEFGARGTLRSWEAAIQAVLKKAA